MQIISPALLLLAVLLPWSGATAADATYALHQSIALTKAGSGFDGALQLVEDARITPALRERMWDMDSDPVDVLDSADPLAAEFRARFVLSARLRLIDASGNLVSEREIDAPLGEIEVTPFPGRREFLLTGGREGGGSGSGHVTELLEIRGGHLAPVTAIDGAGKRSSIFLRDSTWDGWSIVDGGLPGTKEIRSRSCDRGVSLSTSTFRIEGKAWHLKVQKERVVQDCAGVGGQWDGHGVPQG